MKIYFPRSKLLPLCWIAFALLVSLAAHAQAQLNSVEEKVEEIPSQMTLAENGAIPSVHSDAPLTPKVTLFLNALTVDEKISLVHGDADPDYPESLGQVGYLPGVPRLGIPERRDADALGIEVAAESTAPPTRLGLAATFDRAAVYSLGQLEGKEGRALGVDLIYAPHVDLMRQPNWSRNNTAFGEDPFLSGQLAIEEVRGIQSEGLMAMVKHYGIYHGQAGAGGGSTPGEPTLPTVVDERTARELYLKPFEYTIMEGQPASVMASYQGFKIVPRQETPLWATDNPFLLETILREEWDFRGFVLSDYGATHSVHALLSGLDQDYPGWPLFGLFQFAHYQDDLKPLVDPTSSSYDPLYAAALNDAVARVLYGYERFGLLEVSPAPRPNMSDLKDDHGQIAERLSEQSAVLLKNEGRVLPLKGSNLKSVAVIGPTGRQVMANGGQFERSRGFSDRVAISPFQVLQELAPANSNFTFTPGIDWIGSVVPASALPGGLQRTQSDSNAVRTDATIDYGSSSGQNDLAPGVTYTWTGTLVVPADDTYYLWLQHSFGISRFGPFFTSLSIDGTAQSFFRPGVPAGTYAAYSPDPAANILANGANSGVAIHLTAGSHSITITLEVPERAGIPISYPVPGPSLTSPPAFRFTWSRLSDTLNAAVAAARSAKVALVFADDNGEANSALVNSLAANQDALIEAVAEANPNTVVVLSTGGPVLMPWLQDVKAVLQMWYPGQEGGTATAKLLLGQVTPGGKLPFTWPAGEDQTPFAGHPERITGDGTQVVFSEGLFMGYRWYDAEDIEPLFPFGHGLSYTKFRYSHLDIEPKVVKDKGKMDKNTKKPSGNDDDIIRVSFRVTNTGNRAGAEIAQLYVAPVNPPVERPLKELKGFHKVFLKPGESKEVTITLNRRSLAYYNVEAGTWDVARGRYGILVGSSSQNIELRGDLVNLSASSLSVLESTPVPGAKEAAKDSSSAGAGARTETTAAGAPILTVNGGSGSGGYEAGESVTVTADPPPPGKEFAGWSGDTQILANPSAETTTATMPSIDVTITATYADAPSSEQPE